MPHVLQITNWNRYFENNRTREMKRMDWVPMPVKHDGDGYTELVTHADGAAHFGAWCAIVEVAAKCDPRGTLLRDGARPHNSDSLSRLTRLPGSVFEVAIERLLGIGWLERIYLKEQVDTSIPQEGAEKPQEGDASRTRARTRCSVPFRSVPFPNTNTGDGELADGVAEFLNESGIAINANTEIRNLAEELVRERGSAGAMKLWRTAVEKKPHFRIARKLRYALGIANNEAVDAARTETPKPPARVVPGEDVW